jgi:hypothetical protein
MAKIAKINRILLPAIETMRINRCGLQAGRNAEAGRNKCALRSCSAPSFDLHQHACGMNVFSSVQSNNISHIERVFKADIPGFAGDQHQRRELDNGCLVTLKVCMGLKWSIFNAGNRRGRQTAGSITLDIQPLGENCWYVACMTVILSYDTIDTACHSIFKRFIGCCFNLSI